MSNTKMIYDDAKSIGIDDKSLEELMNILTPRMQRQLITSLKEEKFLNDFHNNSEVTQWAAILTKDPTETTGFLLCQFVTTTCSISPTIAIM